MLASSPVGGPNCPNAITAPVRVLFVDGNELTLCVCQDGSCVGMEEFSIFASPLSLFEHLPEQQQECIELETSVRS